MTTPVGSKKSGIYSILNKINNKRYIGKACDIKGRWANHMSELKYEKHVNPHLQRAWIKYGKENFEFSVLEYCEKNLLKDREQHWCDFYNTFNRDLGYNIGKCADSWNRGMKMSKEHCEKLSKIQKERMTPEILQRLRTACLGKKLTEFQKEALRIANLGRPHSEETKQKIRERQKTIQATRSPEETSKIFKHKMKTIYLLSPDKVVFKINGIHGFCREFSLDRGAILRVKKGRTPHHKGWRKFDGEVDQNQVIEKNY
jgi:group I intron endonuclease